MNGLPDDILESILSNLTLKEAARTSVLSRRWRFLWTYFKGKIDFVGEDWQRIERDQLAPTMNEILKLHRGANVESFRIIFYKIHYSMEDFNYWIEFAAKKGVQRLQLILGSYINKINNRVCNTKPQFLKRFSLESLQVLSLRFIEVNDKALGCFLSSSPNLQRLDVQYSRCLSNIEIPSSSRSLKELQVVHCVGLKKIKICARNLEILNCCGPNMISIEVEEVLHQLHTVYYGCSYGAFRLQRITQLWGSLPFFQLEKLELHILPIDNNFLFGMGDHDFNLSKLKCLDLVIHPLSITRALNWISHFLNAAPALHTFTLQFLSVISLGRGRELMAEFQNHGIRRHQCLKVLKIVNFLSIPEVVGFVKTVIDKAESLEMLILVVVSSNCSICSPTLHQDGNTTGQLLEHGFLPPGIELRVESACDGICRIKRDIMFGKTFD